MLNTKHEKRALEEAILGVISGIDKPTSPAGEAKDAFQNALFGRTPEIRRDYRTRVLNVTLEDLNRVASIYLKPELACTAVISNASTVDKKGDLGLEVISL